MIDKLSILKCKLGFPKDNTSKDIELEHLLNVATEELALMGIKLREESVADAELCINYASYLYNFKNSDEGMPSPLKYEIKTRLARCRK